MLKNKKQILRMACPRILLHPNRQQEVDDFHQDINFNDQETPAFITLDSCDIKPVSS